MKTLARVLVLVVCLAALGGMMWRALQGGEAGSGVVEADKEQRTIAYVADTDAGPRFGLPPSAEGSRNVFRVLSYVHLPVRTDLETYSPQRQYVYGLRWIVREADGEQVAEGTIWSQTRKSKANFSGGAWRSESVYYSAGQGSGEPADGRLTDLDLTSYAGRGRTVEFLAVGSPTGPQDAQPDDKPGQINLVVFKQFGRDSFRQQWLERTLSSRRKAELAGYARVRGWSDLSNAERRAILDHGWTRLSSLAEVPTRTMYETEFRLHDSTLVPVAGELIGRRHHLVYNVRGPARLKVALQSEDTSEDRQVQVRAALLSTASESEPDLAYRSIDSQVSVLAAPFGASTLQALAPQAQTVAEIPAGRTASVRLLADVGEPLRAVAFVDRRQAVLGEADMREIGTEDALIRPDWKAFSQWELRPGQPAKYTIVDDERTVGQALRISLRGLADSPEEARLVYRFMNGDEVLGSGKIEPSTELSAFERLEPRMAEQVAEQAAEAPTRLVSEPTTHRFWLPEGATRLELDAEGGSVLAGVSSLVFSEDAMDASKRPPYDQTPAGLSWRYAPSRFQPWQSFHPSNIDSLEADGQRRRVRAQVRLRPDWGALEDAGAVVEALCDDPQRCGFVRRFEPPDPEPEEPVAVTLAPVGEPLSRLIAEPADVQPTNSRAVALLESQWDTSYRTRLEPGVEAPCKIQRGGRIALDYQSPDFGLLGGTLEVLWNGEPVERRLIRTQRDRLYVRPKYARPNAGGQSGRLQVDIRAPNEAATTRVTLSADCSPASATRAARVVRLRRVWRMSRGRSIRVRLPTTADEAPTLYLAAYAPGQSGSLELAARVDGGSPQLRLEGPVDQITTAERTLALEPTDASVDLHSSPPRRLSGPRFAAVPTGTDWKAGWHDVELRAARDQQVWVRFYTKVADPALRAKLE